MANTKAAKGTVYFYAQASCEYSPRCATVEEATACVQEIMQRHNPAVEVKKAVVGVRGFEVVAVYTANCVAR
jgi:hypothetical protein